MAKKINSAPLCIGRETEDSGVNKHFKEKKMKRIGNLFSKIYDIENIRLAHKNASRGKRNYKEIKQVEANKEFYFEEIHKMLKNKTFKNSPYFIFKRVFGKKEREIYKLPYFPDRIIHHCIKVLEPIWVKTFIKDTFSSIKNRGIHAGLKRVKKAARSKDAKYCLKFDIKKFYPSINNQILKNIIRKKIKCAGTLFILDEIIDSVRGVPIGNYLSQFFGNLYLTYFDHLMKEKEKCKNYFRYCDDVVILNKKKQFLHKLIKLIKSCLESLILSLKNNWQVFPIITRGIDFLGYKVFNKFCLLRKSIVISFKQNYQKLKSLMSYKGWMNFSNSFTLFNKYI